MPARPLAPETLQLIDAVRAALAQHAPAAEVEEKSLFGCLVFMVNGKMCLGVEDDELLVRLPPDTHDAVAETPGLRPLSPRGGMQGYFLVSPTAYATRAAWNHWVQAALDFNPQARATPKRKSASKPETENKSAKDSQKRSTQRMPDKGKEPKTLKDPRPRKVHPIFGSE